MAPYESPSATSSLTGPFWAAAAEGRLVRPVCERCGQGFFPPAWCCPACLSESWTYRESSGRGRVYSHTTVYRGPDPSWRVPYVLAIVDLDEGWSMLSRISGEPPDDSVPGVLIGRAVRVSFAGEERPPYRVLPVFELFELSEKYEMPGEGT